MKVLIIPIQQYKTIKKNVDKSEYWFRIHVGLESYIDLINDLKKALNNYEKKNTRFIIYKPSKSAMQSGLYNSDKWCLLSSDINEFFESAKFGWNGSTNPEKKIKLYFETLDEATKVCNKK